MLGAVEESLLISVFVNTLWPADTMKAAPIVWKTGACISKGFTSSKVGNIYTISSQ
jgi:hypothetical protein